MFILLRVLFIVVLLLWGYCHWKEKQTADPFWRRARNWVALFALSVLLVMASGLFIERLLH